MIFDSKKQLSLFFIALTASVNLLADTIDIPPLMGRDSPKKLTEEAIPPPLKALKICDTESKAVLSGSFLFWRASENLDSYAQVVTTENIVDPQKGLGAPRGHNQSVHYQWAPGFNLRAGWETNYDRWDLFFDWTWYQNSTKNNISSKTDSSFNPEDGLAGTENGLGIYSSWLSKWIPAHATDTFSGLPVQPLFPGPFAHATAKWKLFYDTFNIELGKSFKTKTNLFRPFFGLRGALIERMAKAHYTNYKNAGDLLTPMVDLGAFILEGFDSAAYKTKMNFWGIGPLVGVKDELRLPHGWRFTGELFTALFYGQIHSYNQFSLLHFVNHRPSVFAGSKFNNHTQWIPTTNIQLRFGLDWTTCFNHQACEFLIGAAWEQNIWFFHGYSANINQGVMNLMLGGLTTTLQFKF